MLAQEQSVVMRGLSAAKRLEGEFGFGGERQGTAVLTNRRLTFACGVPQEVDLSMTTGSPGVKVRLVFSDVEDLGNVPPDPGNLFIPIFSVTFSAGQKGPFTEPKLEVKWKDQGGNDRGCEFIQGMTGHRGKNLNDWAAVIERLKAGQVKLVSLPTPPPPDTLMGMILGVLGDLQEKGVFEIMGGVEKEFGRTSDPDEVKASCDDLASQGPVIAYPDSSGDTFYKKRSPLGEDNLSS